MSGILRYWLKRLMGSVTFVRRPRKKPILLFSARRGGSTLLMEMLYSQPGINFISEPLNLWYYRPRHYWKTVTKPYRAQFITLQGGDEERKLLDLYNGLLAGSIHLHSQWRWWDRDFSFIEDRFVVKTLNANPLIPWFVRNFDAHVVCLVRHPVSVAASVLRTGWGSVAEAFLRNSVFCQRYLPQTEAARHLVENGNEWEKHLLEATLVNLVPLSEPDPPWMTVTYEELVARPEHMSHMMADRLDLPDPDRLADRLAKPSKSTRGQSVQDIRYAGPRSQLRKGSELIRDRRWAAAVQSVRSIVAAPGYAADTILPDRSLCHFGDLADEFPDLAAP